MKGLRELKAGDPVILIYRKWMSKREMEEKNMNYMEKVAEMLGVELECPKCKHKVHVASVCVDTKIQY